MEKLEPCAPCWCGSGLKYKKCHLDFDNKIATYAYKGFEVPDFESIRTIKELEGIRASAKINTAVLDMVAQKIHVGMSTGEIDRLIHDFTISHGAIPPTSTMKAIQKVSAPPSIMKSATAFRLTTLF